MKRIRYEHNCTYRRHVFLGCSQKRLKSEAGYVGGFDGFAFGALLFVFGTFFVVNAWATTDGKLTATAAAREAARAYVEAPNAQEASKRARIAAENAVAGMSKLHATVAISHDGSPNAFHRCQAIRATVSVRVPQFSLPLIGAFGGTHEVVGSHVENVDPYRSGIPGGTCD